MNIIFGDVANDIAVNHTVLELDEFCVMPSQRMVKTWCVVDHVPLTEFPLLEENRKIHEELIRNYRQRNWQFCRSAVGTLMGRWNGDLDSFYEHLSVRIEQYINNPPDESWHWALVKS